MSNAEIVRAWKDPEYRAMLSEFPPLPIGAIELEDPYLSGNAIAASFAGRTGEHVTITGCGHCNPTSNCTISCHTVSHCPQTGWQCRSIEVNVD